MTGNTPRTVIGLVPDTVYRNALEREPPPFYYLPLAQNYESGVTLHVRAAQGDPLVLLSGVRAAVRAVDSVIVVARPQRLRSVFDQSIAPQRMMATLVGLFGGIGAAARCRRPVRRDGATRRATTHGNRHPPRARRPPTRRFSR